MKELGDGLIDCSKAYVISHRYHYLPRHLCLESEDQFEAAALDLAYEPGKCNIIKFVRKGEIVTQNKNIT